MNGFRPVRIKVRNTALMKAVDLIAKAKAKTATFQLPPKARADVVEVARHNMGARRGQRVTAEQVLQMLRDEHGITVSRATFDTYCHEAFGAPFGGIVVVDAVQPANTNAGGKRK